MDLCLSMIVRDEAACIAETLADITRQFRPRTWVIHDTGSLDATRDIVRAFFADAGIPGRLVERTWENFGANRQYALEDARGTADYVLFFDADDRIDGNIPPLPTGPDALTFNVRRGGVSYPVKHIVRNDGRYRWRGVVHEALYARSEQEHVVHVEGPYAIESRSAGARSRSASTYYRDARLLTDAIATLSDADRDLLPRYTFYCANSWRDAKAPREAAYWYRRRIELSGWADEVYLSWLGLGIELHKSGDADGAVLAFQSGHQVCPERAECLYHLARLMRERGQPHNALIFAREGISKPLPDKSRLFVWHDVYTLWMDFELLSALKDLGRLSEGEEALARMRAGGAPAHLFPLLGVPA